MASICQESALFLLVGGGLGIPPLLYAAQQIHDSPSAQGAVALFGYRDTHFADVFAAEQCDKVLSIDEREGNVITLLDRVIDSDPQNVESIQHPLLWPASDDEGSGPVGIDPWHTRSAES
jgi:hypothetical protein